MLPKTSLLALLILLAACASAPPPAPTGPQTTLTTSRDILLRGVKGALNIDPSVVTRTYTLSCGPAPDGASDVTRAARAAQILTSVNGAISTAGVSPRISESGDAGRANPTLVATLNCSVRQMTTKQKVTGLTETLAYAASNGLLANLMARQ